MSDPGKMKFLRYFLRKFPRSIECVADICEAGDNKHNGGVRTYQGVPNGHHEYSEAMIRHIMAEIMEGPVDSADGKLHAARIVWNALARLEIFLEDKAEIPPADFFFEGEPKGVKKYHTVYGEAVEARKDGYIIVAGNGANGLAEGETCEYSLLVWNSFSKEQQDWIITGDGTEPDEYQKYHKVYNPKSPSGFDWEKINEGKGAPRTMEEKHDHTQV